MRWAQSFLHRSIICHSRRPPNGDRRIRPSSARLSSTFDIIGHEQVSIDDDVAELGYPCLSSPYEVRAYNDQLLQLERAFLNPLGQGAEYTDYK